MNCDSKGLSCVVCKKQMSPWVDVWRCTSCGHLSSKFDPPHSSAKDPLNEIHRIEALKSLRIENGKEILKVLLKLRQGKKGTLCDVGCGYGWFMEVARSSGWVTLGIEPDRFVAANAITRGNDVRTDLFPLALKSEESFDVISFLDVFEHLADSEAILKASNDHLEPGGLLVITLPIRTGILFRWARRFLQLGWKAPWERLWQKSFPSPHLHYFDREGLVHLLKRFGIETIHEQPLPSIMLRGLYARLRMDSQSRWFSSIVQSMMIATAYPILRMSSPDIAMIIGQKVE